MIEIETLQLDWRQIVERHSLRVFRVAMRILDSVHDAEDVAQETFTEAYRLHQSRPIQSWTGLLIRLATLRAIDKLRCRKAVLPMESNSRSSESNAFELLVAKELANRLRVALGKLSDQQATVFIMVHYEEMDHGEIAIHLNISTASVANALCKARQRLTQLLSNESTGNKS